MGIFQESLNSYFTILLITLVALSSCFSSTSMLNSVIAEPTNAASQFTTAKESSIMLINNVKRYLPHVSIVVGIITPNGTQVYGYGNISKANSTIVNGNTIFDIASITDIYYNAFS
jgi:serine-type D-Ala-D-Ala carboxypeptidase/endopeptidase